MKIDRTLDSKMLKIENLNPNWLPWVGVNFNSKDNKEKLLVVSESNYLTEDVDVNMRDYMRKLIEKDGTLEGELYETDPQKHIGQRHKKLEKILGVNQNDISKQRDFWSKTAYYNFIQTPLNSRDMKDRPHFSLYLEGWEVFFKLIDVLKPSFCVMNGVESFNHFYAKNAEFFGYTTIEKIELDKIGVTYPRKIIIENASSGDKIKILFIKHTSRGMNLESWRAFVKSELS